MNLYIDKTRAEYVDETNTDPKGGHKEIKERKKSHCIKKSDRGDKKAYNSFHCLINSTHHLEDVALRRDIEGLHNLRRISHIRYVLR
jgi:hypothetical protein